MRRKAGGCELTYKTGGAGGSWRRDPSSRPQPGFCPRERQGPRARRQRAWVVWAEEPSWKQRLWGAAAWGGGSHQEVPWLTANGIRAQAVMSAWQRVAGAGPAGRARACQAPG